jgi:cytochrome P450
MPPSTPSAFDPLAPAVLECPYAHWAALRSEAPVVEVADGGYWLVSRAEDVRTVVRDPARFSSNLVAAMFAQVGIDVQAARGEGAVDVLATADPPAHARHRRLVNRTFTIHRIAAMETAIRTFAETLLAACDGPATLEWMEAFAVPLPLTVIADVLTLPRADVPRLRLWSDDAIALLSGTTPPGELLALVGSVVSLQQYLGERLATEWDAPRSGIIGDLARAAHDADDPWSRDEVVSILIQLLTAGNETTTSLIGSAVRMLAERPDVQATLRADPLRIPSFIEEVLRLESPFKGHFRVVREACVLGGVSLPAGARLLLLWGSANRDARAFPAADQIDLDRSNPKAHLAFGEGIHFCVGAPLARLEARLALETLLARTRSIQLAKGASVRHLPSVFVRRLAALEIALTR